MSNQHDGEYIFDDPWITGLVRDLQAQLAAATARAEAAESALRLATKSTGSTVVVMSLSDYEGMLAQLAAVTAELDALAAQLAQVDEYGMYCYEWGQEGKVWRPSFAEWQSWQAQEQAQKPDPATGFAELREQFGEHFDAIEDVDAWVQQQRRGE